MWPIYICFHYMTSCKLVSDIRPLGRISSGRDYLLATALSASPGVRRQLFPACREEQLCCALRMKDNHPPKMAPGDEASPNSPSSAAEWRRSALDNCTNAHQPDRWRGRVDLAHAHAVAQPYAHAPHDDHLQSHISLPPSPVPLPANSEARIIRPPQRSPHLPQPSTCAPPRSRRIAHTASLPTLLDEPQSSLVCFVPCYAAVMFPSKAIPLMTLTSAHQEPEH